MPPTIHDIAFPSGERMRTGVEGLDTILGGGLLPGHSLLLQGTPGSGRTALGLQIVAGGARTFGERAIILSLDPFPPQFHREALGFGWDLQQLEAEGVLRVLFATRDDLYSSFAERESLALSKIAEATLELGATRLLIDPGSEFFRVPLPREEQQKVFADFVLKLKGLDLTSVITTEAPVAASNFVPEEAAVDAIVRLEHESAVHTGGRRQRRLEVTKARGQQVIEGPHPFRLGPGGVRVFPYSSLREPSRILERDEELRETMDQDAVQTSTGVQDLDALLGGGLSGSTTLLAGMSGTGKTVLAAEFLRAGVLAGEAGVYICPSEHIQHLLQNMPLEGMNALKRARSEGLLTVLEVDTAAGHPIEFYHQLREEVQRSKVRRVAVDGLRQILNGVGSSQEKVHIFGLLRGLFLEHGIAAVCTYRIEEQSGLSSVAAIPYTAQADDVLYLSLTELNSRLRRVLGVLKTRREHSDAALRELLLTSEGLKLAPLDPLARNDSSINSAQVTSVGRHILLPLAHMRDFINTARVETPEQARLVLTDLRREFNILAGQIALYLEPSELPPESPAEEEKL